MQYNKKEPQNKKWNDSDLQNWNGSAASHDGEPGSILHNIWTTKTPRVGTANV